jgi:voltage-gated potassium channel
MTHSVYRLRKGALVLGIVMILSVCGYRLFGYDWVAAIYMVVITIASVGYGETSNVSTNQQIFTIFVILFGLLATGYTLGGLAQMLFEGELERVLGIQRMNREIENLQQHTILCGYGRTGQLLASELKRHNKRFVVVEHTLASYQQAVENDYLAIHGDATEDKTLLNAGLLRASSLISGLPNDAANVFITLTARNLNKDIQIIARAEFASTEKKLRQAGADRVVLPATIGAQQMVRMITRPSTADLMDLIAQQGNLDLELDEIHVPVASKLIGVTVSDSEAHREHHLLVLAIKQVNGKMIFHPAGDYRFQSQDTIIVLGDSEKILRFRQQYAV